MLSEKARGRLFAALLLCALIAPMLIGGYFVWGMVAHARRQHGVSHVNQQVINPAGFPVVHAHSLIDQYGNTKVVFLQKATRPLNNPVFYWLDLIAIDPPRKTLRCVVQGEPVEMQSYVQVFYVLDDDAPICINLPRNTKIPATADEKWKSLVESQ